MTTEEAGNRGSGERDPAWSGSSVVPTLDVDDLDAGVEFYAKLGFRESWRYPGPVTGDADEEVTHAGLLLGDVELMLAVHEGDAPIQRQNVYIVVDGIEACHAAVKEELGDGVGDLVDTGYGMRDFSLGDPWGHCLTIGQHLGEIEDEGGGAEDGGAGAEAGSGGAEGAADRAEPRGR